MTKKEETPIPPKEGADPKTPLPPKEDDTSAEDIVDKASEVADRIEKANKAAEEIIAKQEKLAVEATLGGEANAGRPIKEDTPEEYAKKVMVNDIETD